MHVQTEAFFRFRVLKTGRETLFHCGRERETVASLLSSFEKREGKRQAGGTGAVKYKAETRVYRNDEREDRSDPARTGGPAGFHQQSFWYFISVLCYSRQTVRTLRLCLQPAQLSRAFPSFLWSAVFPFRPLLPLPSKC